MEQDKIVAIGAGCVAHQLIPALLKAGFNVCQIYSRSETSARSLGMRTGLPYTTDTDSVYSDADIYIFCVNDDAILPVLKQLKLKGNALLIHTSGSVPVSVFEGFSQTYGVLYPLQTFSKEREVDFRNIPLFAEGSSKEAEKCIYAIAYALSEHVALMDSSRRKVLHMAAVWACNFPNHMYALAASILAKEGLDFSLLRPLIAETADKVMQISPGEAQTGPARRNDRGVMRMHLDMLKGDSLKTALYEMVSESITESFSSKDNGQEEADDEPIELSLW